MKFYTAVDIKGNKILLRGYEDGRRVQRDVLYEPYCFQSTRKTNTGYRTIEGNPVEKITFESMSEMRSYLDTHRDVHGISLYGMTNRNSLIYPFIHEYYPGEIQYDASVMNIVFLDIEVAADNGFPNVQNADKEVTAITIMVKDKYYTFGCGDYTPSDSSIHYCKCKDERDLMMRFLTLWDSPLVDPDIISGWNVETFDIPYLVNRIDRIFNDDGKMSKKLSPWKIVEEREFKLRGGLVNKVKELKGVRTLDYLNLYRKFTYSDTESYSLNHISHLELGEKKIDYSEYDSLFDLYKKDFQKFIEYNIHDVSLVSRIDNKMKLIDQVLAIAYDAKVDYIDTLRTVRMWDMIIHNHLIDKGIVVPIDRAFGEEIQKDDPIQGAYVKDPKPGMFKDVVSFDLTSLYPSLIMQYNISPDTKVGKVDITELDCLENSGQFQMAKDDAKLKNYTLCANGTMYRKDIKGFLPELMEKVFADRTKYKKLMLEAKQKYEISKDPEDEKKYIQYNNMQLAKKIQLNSCYGALSNVYFRFFDTELAEAITLSGQVSIRWMQDKMNAYLNNMLKTNGDDYVIAADTDSLYLTLEKFTDKVYGGDRPSVEKVVRMLDKACNEVFQPFIEKSYDELAEHMLVYSQRMQMKRESIANKGIWVAKKRYILNVYNEEGVHYEKPKLKMKGIEAVKSSTPSVVKEGIKNSLYIIMNGTQEDFINYVDEFKNKFEDMLFQDVAFPRSCNLPETKSKMTGKVIDVKYKIGGKSIPIHVRGALVYNLYINKLGLEKKYPIVKNGDKIKFSYLRMPNPIGSNVITAPGMLPKELNLDRYIDYDMQFEKTFIEPMKSITDNIGWSISKQQTLEDMFK
jgi:DNA polymerase elongation subunit (family B)